MPIGTVIKTKVECPEAITPTVAPKGMMPTLAAYINFRFGFRIKATSVLPKDDKRK